MAAGCGRPGHLHAFDADLRLGATAERAGRRTVRVPDVDWYQQSPANAPSFRVDPAVAYVPLRGCVVLAGGVQSGSPIYLHDLWEYVDGDWMRQPDVPETNQIFDLAYDEARSELLLTQLVGPVHLWRHDPGPQPSVVRHGVGCTGSVGVPDLHSQGGGLPALGSQLMLELGSIPAAPSLALFVLGFDLSAVSAMPLPLELSVRMLAGCHMWASDDLTCLVMHEGTTANLMLPIPNDPQLAGLVFAAQALSFDLAAPGGLGAVSNGLVLRVY